VFGVGHRFFTRCKFIGLDDVRDNQFLSEYCKWDNDNSRWDIKMPESTTISSANVYRLEIYHVDKFQVGIKFPASRTAFNFNMQLVNNGGTTREEFVTDLLINEGSPTQSCFKNFVSNIGLKNVFMMRFNPSTTIPADGFVQVHFPTTVMNDEVMFPSFDKTLGTGLFNHESIKCQAFTYAAGVKTAWGGVDKCKVVFGGGSF
jgi:hypothetical protein